MIWLLLAALVVAALAPFLLEQARVQMSDGRRGSAPGAFAELSQGTTHYQFFGPKEGPLIVCIHGLTTPSFVWGPIAKVLAAMGFRVLVYDLFGRGFSDRPTGPQDKAFFNTQLNDLLAHLNLEGPFHLLGYSMGGAIATGYAAQNPTQVRRLVLIAPAGMHLRGSRIMRFIRDRGIVGLWLILALYPFQMRRGIEAERRAHEVPDEISQGQNDQLLYRGFIPAVLASLRGILRYQMQSDHLALRQSNLPILALWGAEDTVIPAHAIGQLAEWNRTITHEVIENAGHGLPYTHTEVLVSHISKFLPAPDGDDWGHDT